MKRDISIGALDSTTFFAEELKLPVLAEIEAITWISDALDQAATERKGVAVVGQKGAGKTVALKRAIDDFDAAERLAQRTDARHERRRVVLIHSPRSKTRRDILAVIWKAVLGMELRPLVRGRTKPDDIILEELVEHMLQQRVAVLVFDEAEYLSDEGLRVIRDLMSLAEATSKERYAEGDYRPAGVGALLVGTPKLTPRLSASEEAGHRWTRVQEVDGLEAEQAAEVYLRFLPKFSQHVDRIGSAAWVDYVRLEVGRGRPIPVRFIENHVRNYVRRMHAADPTFAAINAIPFEHELFDYTLKELLRRKRRDDD